MTEMWTRAARGAIFVALRPSAAPTTARGLSASEPVPDPRAEVGIEARHVAAAAVVPAVLLGVGEAVGAWPLIGAGAGGGGVLGSVSLRATCARWQRRFRRLIEDLSLRTHGVAVERTSQLEE
jgi:hypothetical protein